MEETLLTDPAHEKYFENSAAYKVYLLVIISLNAILLVLSLITIRHILKGSRSMLALKMVSGFIIFTAAEILRELVFNPVLDLINGI